LNLKVVMPGAPVPGSHLSRKPRHCIGSIKSSVVELDCPGESPIHRETLPGG
jgi:hypothetical protein